MVVVVEVELLGQLEVVLVLGLVELLEVVLELLEEVLGLRELELELLGLVQERQVLVRELVQQQLRPSSRHFRQLG